MAAISSKNEFIDAVKHGESYIELEGDLANHVYKLKAKGPVAWAVVGGGFVALGAVALFGTKVGRSLLGKIVTEEPLPIKKSAFALASTGVAVSAIGLSTASAAIGLAITAGGVGILPALRSGYKIIDSRDGYLALQKS